MTGRGNECDVIFLHVHKQHIHETIAGAVASGLRAAFVTPLYNRGLTKSLLGGLPGPVGRLARQNEDPRLAEVRVESGLGWALGRIFVNYAYRRGESRFIQAFDSWCAGRIRNGYLTAKVFYVFQDYLPQTCAAARESGAGLVVEQILNNSRTAQERVISSTQLVSFPVRCPEYPADQGANERIMSMADLVVTPSSYVRHDIEPWVTDNKVVHAPYGAAPRSTPRRPGGGGVTIAVWASSVRKGGHILLETLLATPEADLFPGFDGRIKFLMLGNLDSQFIPAVERVKKERPRVTIEHGYLPHAEVMKKLEEADFFLCPSLSEGMSLAVLEAAGAGLPLVITPYCGLDAFVDGEHGVAIEEGTPEGVKKALCAMFLRRRKWERFGSNARKIIETHPWQAYGKKVAERLRSLLN